MVFYRPYPVPWLWHAYLYIHDCLLMLAFAVHTFYLIFAQFSWEHFKITGYLLGVLVVFRFIHAGLYVLQRRLHVRWSVPIGRRIKQIQFFGLLTLALCGLVPRVLIYAVRWDFYLTYSIIFLFIVLTSMVHHEAFEIGQYPFPYDNTPTVTSVCLLNLALLVGSIRYAVTFPDPWDRGAIIFTQVLCAPVTFVSTLDLAMMGLGRLKVTSLHPLNQPVQRNQVAPMVHVEPVAEARVEMDKIQRSSFDCRGCDKEFSKEKLPKNLIYCDHTICQQCLQANFERNERKYVQCTICLQATVVKGGINKLSTNLALLEVIDEVKKKEA